MLLSLLRSSESDNVASLKHLDLRKDLNTTEDYEDCGDEEEDAEDEETGSACQDEHGDLAHAEDDKQ